MGAAIIFGAMAGAAAGGGPDDGQAADDGSADLQRQREELQAQVSEKYDSAGSDAAIQPADSGEAQPAASDPDDKDPHHWQPVDTGTFRATGAGPDYPDGYLPPGTAYERGEFTSDNGGTPYQAYRLPDGTVFVAPPETVPGDPNNQVVLIHGGLDRILDAKIADRMETNATAASEKALEIGRSFYENMPSPYAAEAAQAPPGMPQLELSGIPWVHRFPTGSSTDDLAEPFKDNVGRFIQAIGHAGGHVNIAATYRPRERAYLMHYASAIARGEIAPQDVPRMAGVPIQWVHPTAAASIQAAKDMAHAYAIKYPPALISRHTERAAIDMDIAGMNGRTIVDANGDNVRINKSLSQ